VQYELAAGNWSGAKALLGALEDFASDGHLIPEQVWIAPDVPERELFRDKLQAAHATCLGACRTCQAPALAADDRMFDTPPQPRERYQVRGVQRHHAIWRFNNKCRRLPAGCALRVELSAAALVHWSVDGWRTVYDTPTVDSDLGIHFADLDTADLKPGNAILFTIYWPAENRWQGVDYQVAVD
jgi:glucoamylase